MLNSNLSEKQLFSNHELLLLIWPLIVEQFLSIMLGIVDMIMVARANLGEAVISGVSLVDSINTLLNGIFGALGAGGAVVCAQYLGRKDDRMASLSAKQLIYTMLAISTVLLVTGVVASYPLLRLIFGNIADDVMTASQTYFKITLLGLPGIALYNGCAALFRSQGNSKVSMWTSLLVNFLNIGGNAILLFGFHRNIEGVAIPTFISRTVAAIVLLALLKQGKSYNGKPAIKIAGLHKVYFDFSIVKKILAIGIPNGLENSMFQIGKILVLSLISSFGTAAIAANAAANTMASFEVLPASSINLAMLTVIGQCMGAKKTDEAVRYTKKLMTIAYVGIVIWNIPLLLSASKILALYKLSPLASKLGLYMSLVHGIGSCLIWPLSFTLPNALRAANDATYTMV
ncbi:MAG: MATE family efflux transporter, partial [Treponema sp.]|nr:MATE family efflux transporter [Treponema sp.]